MNNDYKVYAFFTKVGVGYAGLSITCDVFASDGTQVVTGAAATEISGGLYYYNYYGADDDYLFIFKSVATDVDQKQLSTAYENQASLPSAVWGNPVRTLTGSLPPAIYVPASSQVIQGQISVPSIINGEII